MLPSVWSENARYEYVSSEGGGGDNDDSKRYFWLGRKNLELPMRIIRPNYVILVIAVFTSCTAQEKPCSWADSGTSPRPSGSADAIRARFQSSRSKRPSPYVARRHQAARQ